MDTALVGLFHVGAAILGNWKVMLRPLCLLSNVGRSKRDVHHIQARRAPASIPQETTDMEAGLFTGAALGLSVAVPFGPVSLICVQQSLNRGYGYGVISGFGAATSQGIFATAAIVGAGSVSVAVMPWSSTITLVSAVILVCLGAWTIVRARSVPNPADVVSMRKAYASTLLLSLSNPMTVIPYLAFATVAAEGRIGSAALSLWSVPGVIVAAGTWYAVLSLVTSTMRSSISPGMAYFLNLAAGSSLIVFGLIVGRRLLAL